MRNRARIRRGMSEGGWVVLSILVILALCVFWPRRREPGVDIRQSAQMHAIDAAVELFTNEWGAYPPSDANDGTGQPYCGAMKLAEAIMGQDLLGFHRASGFRADGLDPNGGADLYPDEMIEENLRMRKGPYLQRETANAYRLADIYGADNTGPFSEDTYVLCDTFVHKRPGGAKTGMPILYYRADLNGTLHEPNDPDNPANIYHWRDNAALVGLGVPGDRLARHPLADPNRFYLNTQSDKITTASRPFRADSYIFISAGWDGLYGTADDTCNFAWKYRE